MHIYLSYHPGVVWTQRDVSKLPQSSFGSGNAKIVYWRELAWCQRRQWSFFPGQICNLNFERRLSFDESTDRLRLLLSSLWRHGPFLGEGSAGSLRHFRSASSWSSLETDCPLCQWISGNLWRDGLFHCRCSTRSLALQGCSVQLLGWSISLRLNRFPAALNVSLQSLRTRSSREWELLWSWLIEHLPLEACLRRMTLRLWMCRSILPSEK